MADFIDPQREQFEFFKTLPRDTPINMLNLVRFRAKANYDDGRDITGKEAYRRYGQESSPIFARVGGTIIWRGKPEAVLTGPSDEQWDTGFIARYPHAGAFFEMITDPAYKLAVKHRQAAVQTSRLIRFAELEQSNSFAG
ncbi:MAG: DUF1330 domain-containing protein [Pseudomonadota bacterium]